MRFLNQVVFITGAARGIGKSFAEAFAKEGCRVVIADINIDQANSTAQQIGPNALALMMDVTKQDSIDRAVNTAVDQLGGIDILINNAAVFTAAPITEIRRED